MAKHAAGEYVSSFDMWDETMWIFDGDSCVFTIPVVIGTDSIGRGRHNLDRMQEWIEYETEQDRAADVNGECYWVAVPVGMVRATYHTDGCADVYRETGVWDDTVRSTQELIGTTAI